MSAISELVQAVEKAESARSINAQQVIDWTNRFVELGQNLGLITTQGEFSDAAASALAKTIDPVAAALEQVPEPAEG